MRDRLASSLLLAALCLPACAGAGADDTPVAPPADPSNVAAMQSKLLASTDVGYGTVEFHQMTTSDQRTVIVVTEKASAYLRRTPMDALMRTRPLTSLEIFRAINPGQAAPEEITSAHAAEAAGLGRANADILPATFDRDAPVEKSSAGCDAWVFESPGACELWGRQLRIDSASGTPTVVLPVGRSTSDFSYQTMSTVAVGACNDTGANEFDRFITQVDANGPWNFSGWFTIAPFTGNRHWINVSFSTSGCGIAGCQHLGAYREQGWGSNVHLRSAEEQFDSNCIR